MWLETHDRTAINLDMVQEIRIRRNYDSLPAEAQYRVETVFKTRFDFTTERDVRDFAIIQFCRDLAEAERYLADLLTTLRARGASVITRESLTAPQEETHARD